ncbi:MAG TPA: asparagine synthase-related protein, partial [Pyrinomonadaceae bacterium]|nr:asparagine synthase-related protein [Pyrinomonadaceae bacterium]
FASEIKALLASGLVEPEIDPVALRLLLTHGAIIQPRTILRDVQMLLPAHRLILKAGHGPRIERYWSLGINRLGGLREQPYEEQVEEVAHALKESVRLQMVSDVPLGAFLSGGVDSSLLVAMLAQQVSGHRVRTFSVGFEAEGADIDETGGAERTARFIGADHTRVVVSGNEVRDRIRHIAYALDQPSVDGVNSYFVSMAARTGVTVAISGTGGDELFAGYPWFGRMMLAQRYRESTVWKSLAKSVMASVTRTPALDPLVTSRGGQLFGRLRESSGFLTHYFANNPIFEVASAASILSPDLRRAAQAGRSPHYDLLPIDELPRASVLERVTGVCLRGYTTNQLLRDIDAASMSHSLEVRVPYLDPVIADTALSLPDNAKMGAMPEEGARERTYREAGTKRILLDVGKKLLPEGFDTIPKRGFGMPFASWLRGPLKDVLFETLSEQTVKARGLLSAQMVSTVRDEFMAGHLQWPQPWLLMMLELWFREVLDHKEAYKDPQKGT